MIFIVISKKVVICTILLWGASVNFRNTPCVPSTSHPRELPLDCSHLRLAFADLLLALEMVEVSLPVLPLAVYDLTSFLHDEAVFRLALCHGVAVLHAALVAFDVSYPSLNLWSAE